MADKKMVDEILEVLTPVTKKTDEIDALAKELKSVVEKNQKDVNKLNETIKAIDNAVSLLKLKGTYKNGSLLEIAKAFKDAKKKAINEGTDSEGGYVVPTENANQIFAWLGGVSMIRRYGTVIPMTSDNMVIPASSSVVVRWMGEGAQYTNDDKPTFSNVGGLAKKLMGYLVLSNEVIDDASIPLLDFLFQLILTAMADEEDRVTFVGDTGNGDPFNGIGYDANTVKSVLASGKTAYSDTELKDIIELPGLVNARALNNAAYYMHPSMFYSLVVAEGTTNQAINITSPEKTIAGFPVRFVGTMPAYSTSANADKPFIVFGDLKQAVLGDRMNYKLDVSRDVKFDYDQAALRVIERIKIGVGLGDAFAVLKTAAS